MVCLEQGEWLEYLEIPSVNDDCEAARQRQWNPNPNIRCNAADYPVNDDDTLLKPLMLNAVGGTSIMWLCHAPWFHPLDLKIRSMDGEGNDWPLSYWGLEPYYDLNDTMSGVSGLSGDSGNSPRKARPLGPLPIGKGAARLVSAVMPTRIRWGRRMRVLRAPRRW